MKKVRQLAVLMLVAALATGCASTGGYLANRGRDFADIFTLGVELGGLNASAQVGPIATGLGFAKGKGWGLVQGNLGPYEFEEMNFVVVGSKLVALNPEADYAGYMIGYEWVRTLVLLPTTIVVSMISGDSDGETLDTKPFRVGHGGWRPCFQIEADVNVLGGLRAGINLAEGLDFILGWTTLDIFNDDVEKRNRIEPKSEPYKE